MLKSCGIACRMLHHTHHKYNKEHTLSPFAGLAFNPFDGILQVLPLHSLILDCRRVQSVLSCQHTPLVTEFDQTP